MNPVHAWRLEPGQVSIAIARNDLVEVLHDVNAMGLPIGPRWCREILAWRGRLIPLASATGSGAGNGAENDLAYAAVIALQPDPERDETEYVAIRIRTPPLAIEVGAGQDREPPADPVFPREYLLACFEDGEDPVAVIDLARLFAVNAGGPPQSID
ncbi:MAG: hypothetical protein LC637_10160 [Xanthomonadaceae bacterium]|nr:hypothetical protein [Xanthomonadaceae bacterium]